MIADTIRRVGRRLLARPRDLSVRYPQFEFGRGTYDGNDLEVRALGEGVTLKVGAFCSIATGVQVFLRGDHRGDWVTTFPFSVLWPSATRFKGHPATKGDVVIGNDVWIGTEALILSGVTIGDGAIVGARAVVTKDVAPYSIVVGNPAREVRKRFNDDTIERLLSVRWWDWSDSMIEEFIPLLLSADVAAFLDAAELRGLGGQCSST
jgi:chloramphenicol O-acetyltransferase type B